MASLIERCSYVVQKVIGDSRSLRRADPECIPGSTDRPDLVLSSNAEVERLTAHLQAFNIAGVFKTTRPGRLQETERALCASLSGQDSAQVRFLDIGASDGTTTLDAVKALKENLAVPVEAYLTDRFVELHRYRLGPFVEYRTAAGAAVLARLWMIGLSVSTHRPDAVAEQYQRANWLRDRLRPAGRISLVDPGVRAQPGIRVHVLDCFIRDPDLEGLFDAVRASNILLLCYFTPERISVALNHLHSYLKDGGVLVVSRNTLEGDCEVEHGSSWRRSRAGFEHLGDFGNGYEARDLVDTFSTSAG